MAIRVLLRYRGLLKTVDRLGLATLRSSFRDIRPSEAVSGNAVAWWTFATDAVLRDYRRINRPWSWSFIAARRDQVRC